MTTTQINSNLQLAIQYSDKRSVNYSIAKAINYAEIALAEDPKSAFNTT